MLSGSSKMCLLVLVLFIFSCIDITIADEKWTIDTIPGYPGKLPFEFETGYISVGDLDEVQLYYYFFESERNPVADPLLFWLTGGPGCSGFSAIAYENGPLHFNYTYSGGVPSILINKYSWTKVASIIYIDAPVGAGFSYSTTSEGYYTSDTKSSHQSYTFLRKWLLDHPQYLENQLYVGGDSYSGIIVPQLVQHILTGLEAGVVPKIQIQGYMLGNPVTDNTIDVNARIPYVHRVNLISDEYYESAKYYCNEDYINIDYNNTACVATMETIRSVLLQINLAQILEPQCAYASRKTQLNWNLRVREAEDMEYFLSEKSEKLPELPCRGFTYVLGYKYMNDKSVQKAFHVREGTVENWYRCPKGLSYYTEDVTSTIANHLILTTSGLRALIYSGDHDISVPYIGTLKWIKSLGLNEFDQWRPWFVQGQIAGYQVKYMNDNFRLTYATLKGAGHTAPEYKPMEALNLVDRFFARYPI